ncbi:glycine cleavage system protein GcvH [Clostridium aciditolerans]|uniref:Glycine cleavage system H protein n=1 Tax=Clostridium aciditolerans TaxID=339861 RepID=A0A934M013_9CLOT|nr:glycine cleavage system protein GcvH [Clostridium aciditolerans]MBI6871604.1 glycine cleavage system protein GcvH [Clostridium aciditolerans]
MKILNELLYSKDHEWVKVDGDKAYIGISDFAQHSLGEIVFVELPEVDTEFSKDEAFGVVESVKAASDLYIPVGGKVVEINEKLVDNPELVNEDAYGSWMIVVELSDKSELDALLKADQYEKLCDKGE